MKPYHLLSTIFFSLFLSIPISLCNAQESSICQTESISMNQIYKDWDGQWQGIIAASDGNCYFGTSVEKNQLYIIH